MAIEDILRYIETNKNQFSLAELSDQLRKNGYPENEIQEALKPQGGITAIVKASFFGQAQTKGQKVVHFILGFLTSILLSAVLGWVLLESISSICICYGGPNYFGLIYYVSLMWGGPIFLYLLIRKRQRYFARGVLLGLTVPFLLVAVGIFVWLSYSRHNGFFF